MKSWLAEVQTGFEPLFFHIQADFQWQRPFSEGCGGEIPEETKKNLSQSYGRWIVGFHEPSPAPFLRSKRALQIGGMIVCFGLCPCQHNGTYTRNVHPATPTKKLLKFYVLPRVKKSRFPEKFSEKRLKKPWVKVQVHRICQSPFWHLFVTPLKMGAKSPEVVETSRLFAAASFLVQLDGGPEETRTLDLSDANRTLSRMVQIYAPKILEKM